MTINIIACVSSNYALGYRNELLFEIKEDLRRFQKLTKGHLLVQGRKTFQSIINRNNKPLGNGRTNIVLTRDNSYLPKHGEIVFNSVERILSHHKTMSECDKEIWVIGGESLFKEFLPHASNIYLTHVNKYVFDFDTEYPYELQKSLGFIPAESEEYYSDKYNCAYKFTQYTRPDATKDEE